MTEQGTTKNLGLIRLLTYLMFLMFAMTTDAVGVIIPEVIAEFGLSLTRGRCISLCIDDCDRNQRSGAWFPCG